MDRRSNERCAVHCAQVEPAFLSMDPVHGDVWIRRRIGLDEPRTRGLTVNLHPTGGAEQQTDPSAPHSADGLVVLRESELESDLATAIDQVRAEEETRHARILIIGRDEGDESSTEPDEANEPGALSELPSSARQRSRIAEGQMLAGIGERLETLVDCLDMFGDEIGSVVEELSGKVVDAPRAHWQSALQRATEILSWSAEVSRELRVEANQLREGRRRCGLNELLREAVDWVRLARPGIEIRCAAPLLDEPEVCVRAEEMAEALYLVIDSAASRNAGRGVVEVSQSVDRGFSVVTVVATDSVSPPSSSPAQILRFRSIVAAHGGSVVPALHGPGGGSSAGVGVAIRLPPC